MSVENRLASEAGQSLGLYTQSVIVPAAPAPALPGLYIGTDDDDSLVGSAADDVFVGYGGNDSFSGVGGGDIARGDGGDDRIDGGKGDDFLRGDGGADALIGGDGADILQGGSGGDLLYGDGESDTLWGGSGADSLYGGIGDDLLNGGSGIDHLDGEIGDDTLWGNSENDDLSGGEGDDAVYGGTGADVLYGGSGNDLLKGGSEGDELFGDEGDDSLSGESDDDRLNGGAGNDSLSGGWERDTLDGESGNDKLNGGEDADLLIGGAGDDTLLGSAGNDTLTGTQYGAYLDTEFEFNWARNDSVSQATWVANAVGVRGALAPFLRPTQHIEDSLGAGEVDRFVLNADPGQSVALVSRLTTWGNDPFIGAFDGSGTLLQSGSWINATADADGKIYLAVSQYWDQDFDGIDDFGGGPTSEVGGYEVLAFPNHSTDQLYDLRFSPDVDFYHFGGLQAGSTFTAEVLNSSLDTVLGWFDETGQLIAFDDDSGDGTLSKLTGVVPSSGSLVLAVSGHGDAGFSGAHDLSGDYLLSVTTDAGLDGNDVFWGGKGADRFAVQFANGDDVIRDFNPAQGDVIDLTAFGFANAQDVFDRFAATGTGTRIDLPFGGSLTVTGLAPSDLDVAAYFLI